jgi:hypothetical protein
MRTSDNLRRKMARTERPTEAVEPVLGNKDAAGDEDTVQVVTSTLGVAQRQSN